MKTKLCCDLLKHLEGKTLSTAESITGGGIGAAITAIPGSSGVYKGGVVCYTNEVKRQLLGVPEEILSQYGAVSEQTAAAMAQGVRQRLDTDFSVSVTGLAGPAGDDRGNPVGRVYIGCAGEGYLTVKGYLFSGTREQIREQTILAALELLLKEQE